MTFYLTKKKKLKKNQYIILNNFLQCMIKKGNKSTNEITFKKMLFYMAKNKKIFSKNSWVIIMKGFYNITPNINLKIIKIKRRIFYNLKFITSKKQSYLICSWLINGMKKNHHNFYKNLAQEFKEASLKKGEAYQKYLTFYKTIESNIHIYKKT